MLEERRNQCDLIELFMLNSYTGIDITGFYSHLMVMIKVYMAIIKNNCKVRFNTYIRKFFSNRVIQMEQFGPGHCWCTQPELFKKYTT